MNWSLFLAALIAAESGGDRTAVGDAHLRNRAFGVCQIRKPFLDDVNRIAGTSWTLVEVARCPGLSRWSVATYLRHYGARYERLTGKPLDLEAAYRIHNGGPDGWRRQSTDAATVRFLAEIRRLSEQGGSDK
jgi:hypothetical protein